MIKQEPCPSDQRPGLVDPRDSQLPEQVPGPDLPEPKDVPAPSPEDIPPPSPQDVPAPPPLDDPVPTPQDVPPQDPQPL